MKKITVIIVALCTALTLTGCGSYDLSDYELTNAIGVSREKIDEIEYEPNKSESTGDAEFDQLLAASGSDSYSYWMQNSSGSDSYDVINMDFHGDEVCEVSVAVYNGDSSDYSILGIRVGDSRASALDTAEEFFEKKGSALSDDKEKWQLMDGDRDMVTFGSGNDKHGMLFIYIDTETDKVSSLEYSKF